MTIRNSLHTVLTSCVQPFRTDGQPFRTAMGTTIDNQSDHDLRFEVFLLLHLLQLYCLPLLMCSSSSPIKSFIGSHRPTGS